MSNIYAPGQRIIVRDTEWVIRRVDLMADNGYQLKCDGVSNFVKGKAITFLTSYERNIVVVDPKETTLTIDKSSGYERSLLYMESLLRELVPTDGKIYRGHKAAMDVVPYQFEPALQALKQPRQRILMGDAVGLGKTLEAGILTSELIKRGKGKRILVLAVKSMLTQFQKEFWNRFSIPLTRLDSQGIQRVRSKIPANMNPFFYYDKSIISIDTLKQEALYRSYIEESYWDVIIIDEAHNVADRNSGSQKSKLAQLVSERCDTLLMLSATPHDGSAKSFASLLNMLDPTAIANVNDYGIDDFKDKGLVIRRFKKDIQDQVGDEFKPRKIFVEEGKAQASFPEEQAFSLLSNLKFVSIDAKTRKGTGLFKTTLVKSLMSSPGACIASINERLKKLIAKEEEDFIEDIDALTVLRDQLETVSVEEFSKYQRLVKLISKDMKWKKAKSNDRIVIFTERIATLNFLAKQLKKDLKLNDTQLVTMTGSMSDIDVNKIVEDFGQAESKVRVLIATDVASEGINLHYQSHRLIHFDIPWSLMVFQQRNGRVDRYGQEQEPEIYYMQTVSQDEAFKGDNRIIEILIQKDEQAAKNIGDPSAFMNVYDADKEEAITAAAIVAGKDADEFSAELDKNIDDAEFDILSMLQSDEVSVVEEELKYETMPSLFESDHHYATNAFKYMRQQSTLGVDVRLGEDDRIGLKAPKDLEYRFKMLPREIWPKDGYFILCDDQAVINREIVESRKSESAWPQIHYLWEQHPVMEWVRDKLLSNFDRMEAPLLNLPTLQNDEVIFIVSGLIPNQKAQPLIHHWLGVRFKGGQFQEVITMDQVIEDTQLTAKRYPNPGVEYDTEHIQTLLPQAIEAAHIRVLEERKKFDDISDAKLDEQLKRLDAQRRRHLEQLDIDLGTDKRQETKKEERKRKINNVFDNYMQWIEQSMVTEKTPYIQVIAALHGGQP